MTAVVTATLAVAAGLLAAAGVGKLRVPDGAMALLNDLRLPSGRVAARVLGLAEISVGVAAVAVAGRVGAALLASSYAALLLVAIRARRRQVDCGCFGAPTGTVTRAHLAIDGGAALVGIAGLVWPPLPASHLVAEAGALLAVVAVALVLTAVAAVRLLLMAVPRLAEATR